MSKKEDLVLSADGMERSLAEYFLASNRPLGVICSETPSGSLESTFRSLLSKRKDAKERGITIDSMSLHPNVNEMYGSMFSDDVDLGLELLQADSKYIDDYLWRPIAAQEGLLTQNEIIHRATVHNANVDVFKLTERIQKGFEPGELTWVMAGRQCGKSYMSLQYLKNECYQQMDEVFAKILDLKIRGIVSPHINIEVKEVMKWVFGGYDEGMVEQYKEWSKLKEQYND